MLGKKVGHPRPGVLLKVHELKSNTAASKKWRFRERRGAIAAQVFEDQRRVWLTEEAARHRHRALLDDNPTSG